jgi:phospholipid/cholesterol/gamma-HCH transport system substrate-binding protein
MRRINTELAVGLFIILGVGCLTFLAVKMGNLRVNYADSYPVQARFTSISGLREGAFVEVAGVRVGRVTSIALDHKTYAAEITMSIDNRVRLQEDAIASVRSTGIIGDKFVKITPGGSDVYLQPGEFLLDTESSISLEELISKYIFQGKD